jgi:hypothetical protein
MVERFAVLKQGRICWGECGASSFSGFRTQLPSAAPTRWTSNSPLTSGDEKRTMVIALPHPVLLELSRKVGRPVTDPWCARLAAGYLKYMIESGDDFEKAIVSARREILEQIVSGAAAQSVIRK